VLRNFFLLNLLLVAVIVVLGIKLYGTANTELEIPMEPTVARTPKMKSASVPDRAVREREYEPVVALDLFRPSRSPAAKKVKKAEEAPKMEHPPKLFGTIIFNDHRSAIIQDPETNTTRTYKLDDSIGGFKLTEILEDKIVMTRGDEKMEVKLRADKGIKAHVPRVKPRNRKTVRAEPTARRSRPVPPRRRRPRRVRPAPGR